jgi:hypothetical protein
MGNVFNDESDKKYLIDNNINSLNKNNSIIVTNSQTYSKSDSFEATVTNIKSIDKTKFKISTTPTNNIQNLYLNKDHPNFIDLYNKLKIGDTYKFIPESYAWYTDISVKSIVDIFPCETHNVTKLIKGFLNTVAELNIGNYHEIVTNNVNNSKRLMIHIDEINNMVVGEFYKIQYIKKWKDNLYLVTNYELCNK